MIVIANTVSNTHLISQQESAKFTPAAAVWLKIALHGLCKNGYPKA